MPNINIRRTDDSKLVQLSIDQDAMLVRNGDVLAFCVHFNDGSSQFYLLSTRANAPAKASLFKDTLGSLASLAGAASAATFFSRWGTKAAAVGAISAGLLPLLGRKLAALYPRLERNQRYHYVNQDGQIVFDGPLVLAG
jgi:hypothetical protein